MEQKIQTRKEREREFKKSEILNAAIHIFANKGFKATTLDKIAEKAEFGKGTIYNYFSSKEDIYKEIIIYISSLHKKSIIEVELNTETFYDFIFENTKNHMMFSVNNRDAFVLLISSTMHHSKSTSYEISELMDKNHKEITSIFVDRTRTAIENFEIMGFDPKKIIRLSRGMTFTYIYESLISGELNKDNIDEEAKYITDILFNGIKLK